MSPIIAPLGFGTWQAGATLIPGFLAKEVIISSMAILYSSSEDGLVHVIQQFTPLSAYAFMIFILLYVPCISTVATIRKKRVHGNGHYSHSFIRLLLHMD